MSEVRTNAKPANFFDRYDRGDVSSKEFDDFIDRRHDLSETWAEDLPMREYRALGCDGEVRLHDPCARLYLLKTRSSGRSLVTERCKITRRTNDPADNSILISVSNRPEAHSDE